MFRPARDKTTTMISILRVILAPLALMAWQLVYPTNCLALILPALTAVILFLYIWHVRSVPQKLVADFYFSKRTLIYGFFFSRIRLFLFGSIYAVVLSATLYITASLWTPIYFGVLTADALILFFIYHMMASWSRSGLSVAPGNVPLVSKQIVVALNSLALIIVFTWLALDGVPPAYAQVSGGFLAVMEAAADGRFSNCDYINPIISVARQVEGIKYHLVDLSTKLVDNGQIQVLTASVLLFAGGLPALAYSQFVLQLISGGTAEDAQA